jgi:hypothetical protein
MRWRRIVLFAIVVIAHFLVLRFFPADPATPQDPPEREIALATLISPGPVEPQGPLAKPLGRAATIHSKFPARKARAAQNAGTSELSKVAESSHNPASASIDWGKEAELAAADRVQSDREAARQAAALSQWRLRMVPAPKLPAPSEFAWDYAQTHHLESSARGLIVNLNDRCAVLINPLAILVGCSLGQMPVHGDLFVHMKEIKEAGESQDH